MNTAHIDTTHQADPLGETNFYMQRGESEDNKIEKRIRKGRVSKLASCVIALVCGVESNFTLAQTVSATSVTHVPSANTLYQLETNLVEAQ